MYREWLMQELVAAGAMHLEACPRRFDVAAGPSNGCPGCVREAQIVAEDREIGRP